MIKGFIFDFDGVLVDSEEIQKEALFDVLKKIGVEPPLKEEFQEYQGCLTEEVFQKILEKRGITGLDLNELTAQRRKRARDLIEKKGVAVNDGALELVQSLKNRNLKIAVGSAGSRKRVELMLQKTGFDKMIDALAAGDEVTKGKPDPEIFRLAAQKLTLQPEEVIVIEDAKNGVEAAKAAGMFCIGLDNGVGQDLSRADVVVKSLKEININNLLS